MSNHDALFAPQSAAIEHLISYQQKGVGVDMALKSILGIFRLAMLYSKNAMTKSVYTKIVDVIIECRMLTNFGRSGFTLYQLNNQMKKSNYIVKAQYIFTYLSYFFRIFEQLSGDLGYMQKVVFRTWSRATLSFYYRFFKSLSLTCALLVELCRSPMVEHRLREATTPQEMCIARRELAVSRVLIVRNLCDMYVYYKWLPNYTPIRTIEYICGMISGMIGVWLVWSDVAPCVQQKESESAKSNHDLGNTLNTNSLSAVLAEGDSGDGSDM